MAPILSNELLNDADLVYIEKETGNVYTCLLNARTLPEGRELTNEEKEQHPSWSVCRLEQILDEDGNTTIRRMYPNGMKNFQFCPAKMLDYDYKYAE